MRDPHVHVERGVVMLTHAQMREAITQVTGLAVDAPKTVTTGCGRRRPYAMTSAGPAAVTCLACREHAAAQHDLLAAAAEAIVSLADTGPDMAAGIADQAGGIEAVAALGRDHRAQAAAFRGHGAATGRGARVRGAGDDRC